MLRWKILLITLTAAAVSLVYVVAAPYIFTYLLPRYIGAVFYTQIYSLNIVLAAAGTFPGVFLDSQLETKRKYTISIFSSVSKIVLMSILVFPFGLVGIIAAEMAVRACTLCIYYVLIRTM
jgi:O-antigen/teichoic acid export membrane protein